MAEEKQQQEASAVAAAESVTVLRLRRHQKRRHQQCFFFLGGWQPSRCAVIKPVACACARTRCRRCLAKFEQDDTQGRPAGVHCISRQATPALICSQRPKRQRDEKAVAGGGGCTRTHAPVAPTAHKSLRLLLSACNVQAVNATIKDQHARALLLIERSGAKRRRLR
jgi:hypothetical protein